ncbi:hypothetical protein DRO97_11105, partial [Archaeoglobales archaeon]
KKRLFTLVIFTIITVVGIASANGIVFSSDEYGNEKNEFAPNEEVYVKGYGLTDNQEVNVYVVINEDWTDGEDIDKGGNVLFYKTVNSNDIDENGPLELGTVSNDGGQYDIPYPGEYDIVYDANKDGKYDSSAGDLVDYVYCQGFQTIPEFTTIALPAAIAMLGAMFYLRRR